MVGLSTDDRARNGANPSARVYSVHWTRIDCSSLADDAGGPLRGEDSDWIVDGKSTA